MRERRWGRVLCSPRAWWREPSPVLVLSSAHRAGLLAALEDRSRARWPGDGVTVNLSAPGLIATIARIELGADQSGAVAGTAPGGFWTVEEFAAAAGSCAQRERVTSRSCAAGGRRRDEERLAVAYISQANERWRRAAARRRVRRRRAGALVAFLAMLAVGEALALGSQSGSGSHPVGGGQPSGGRAESSGSAGGRGKWDRAAVRCRDCLQSQRATPGEAHVIGADRRARSRAHFRRNGFCAPCVARIIRTLAATGAHATILPMGPTAGPGLHRHRRFAGWWPKASPGRQPHIPAPRCTARAAGRIPDGSLPGRVVDRADVRRHGAPSFAPLMAPITGHAHDRWGERVQPR